MENRKRSKFFHWMQYRFEVTLINMLPGNIFVSSISSHKGIPMGAIGNINKTKQKQKHSPGMWKQDCLDCFFEAVTSLVNINSW